MIGTHYRYVIAYDLVSIESCRGLEGWSTLVLNIDYWYHLCLSKEKKRNPNMEFGHIQTLPSWFLIPFTRAKSRMLIELPTNPELRKTLLDIQSECKDFVEVLY